MSQEQGVAREITDYFKRPQAQPQDHQEILQLLKDNIDHKKQQRSEKAVIASLLEKIETENDSVKIQFYRRALELLLRGVNR